MTAQQHFKIPRWISITFIAVVSVLVLINVFSPLRLNTDSIRYLLILEFLKGNLGNNSVAAHDFLPHGYPWLLFLLDKLHILNSLSITLLNILAITASAILYINILKIERPLLYLSLVLLSYLNVKHFTLGVSDQFFTLIFTLSIYFWVRFFKDKAIFIIPALLFTIFSVWVRTAGIAVVVGIMAYLIYQNRVKLFKRKATVSLFLAIPIIFAIAFFLNLHFFEKKIDYIRQLKLELLLDKPILIFDRLSIHLQELGEFFVNVPASKLWGIVGSAMLIKYIFGAMGLILLFVLYTSIRKVKLFENFAFWALAGYSATIAIWPYFDARFLIPVIPLMVYLTVYYLQNIKTNYMVKAGWLGIYTILGLMSLLYSDAVSLSKPFFINHYGFKPELTSHYILHFKNQQLPDKAKPVYDVKKDRDMFLLEKYDR